VSDHHPRYVVREQFGVTVGDNFASRNFLILDSWYGYVEVLHVKRQRGSTAGLRRRVHKYAALLNDPPECRCGCGVIMEPGPFAAHWSGMPRAYASSRCIARAKWRRKKVRRGRVA
jgi:hypothetical protein